MKRGERTPWWVWLIVVIIVLVVIIIFVGSLGTVDVENKLPQEFKDSKDEALKRHKALLAELDKKKALKEKLTRLFKYSYFAVRVSLVIICSGSIYLLGDLLGAQTLSDFLNYYEASIIALFAMNFIAFGTIASFQGFIHLLRTKVENWIWSKYISLPKEIDFMEKEIEGLNVQIANSQVVLGLPPTTSEDLK